MLGCGSGLLHAFLPRSLNRTGCLVETAGGKGLRRLRPQSRARGVGRHPRACVSWVQGMIALRRGATELTHEDYMEGILEVQAKKKANLQYYA